MGRFSKRLALILIMAVSSLIVIGSVPIGKAQNSTNENGIISSDTTWTQAGSPYLLTGNVLVDNGITLTIKPGTVVNLNSYYIMINGSLVAKGTSTNQITFQSTGFGNGKLIFTQSSTAYNEQKGIGSVIDNALLNLTSLTINNASPLITNCHSIPVGGFVYGGSILINGGSPIITNNQMDSGQIIVNEGSPLISNNYIVSNQAIVIQGGSPIVSKNTIQGGTGIQIQTGNPIVSDNNISNCETGLIANTGIIQRNYIFAITKLGNVTFQNNTDLSTIYIEGFSSPTFIYNNFNNEGNIFLTSSNNLDASYNWWGTTDKSAIQLHIYDYNKDFNLGTVNYIPFLTAPNPQALPDLNAPIPTTIPIASLEPTATSTVPEFPSLTILAFLSALLAVAVVSLMRKHKLRKKDLPLSPT